MANKIAIKKTGYKDIDTRLVDTHTLLRQGELLKKDIEISLKYKPVNPYTSRKARIKKFLKLRSILNKK